MRPAILVLIAALTLAGCSTALAPTLPTQAANATASTLGSAVAAPQAMAAAGARPSAIVPVAASPAIDLGALAQIVARLPNDFYRFEVDLFICAGAIVAIGIVNAFLIASLLATRRRDASRSRTTAPAVAPIAPVEPAELADPAEPAGYADVAGPLVAVVTARVCACGAAIAARSKTGRCRRCATASRTKRPQREVATARA